MSDFEPGWNEIKTSIECAGNKSVINDIFDIRHYKFSLGFVRFLFRSLSLAYTNPMSVKWKALHSFEMFRIFSPPHRNLLNKHSLCFALFSIILTIYDSRGIATPLFQSWMAPCLLSAWWWWNLGNPIPSCYSAPRIFGVCTASAWFRT